LRDTPFLDVDSADFNQETEWERFTMNSTMISFENLVVYDHYQVLFIVFVVLLCL